MASEFWDHYFGDQPDADSDLDEAITEAPDVFAYVPLDQRIEALHHACASARRLDGTIYWDRAHAQVDRLLDDIVGR